MALPVEVLKGQDFRSRATIQFATETRRDELADLFRHYSSMTRTCARPSSTEPARDPPPTSPSQGRRGVEERSLCPLPDGEEHLRSPLLRPRPLRLGGHFRERIGQFGVAQVAVHGGQV